MGVSIEKKSLLVVVSLVVVVLFYYLLIMYRQPIVSLAFTYRVLASWLDFSGSRE